LDQLVEVAIGDAGVRLMLLVPFRRRRRVGFVVFVCDTSVSARLLPVTSVTCGLDGLDCPKPIVAARLGGEDTGLFQEIGQFGELDSERVGARGPRTPLRVDLLADRDGVDGRQ
jgi:hypothetical protein